MDDNDYQNEAVDHHTEGDYNHHNNDNYNLNDDNQDEECDDDDDFCRLSLFKSPEIFRILSIETHPTDMKSRLHEYQSKDSLAVCEVNGVELSFHIEGDLGNMHPELKQFLCVYIVHTRVTIKNGDILPHGVFLSSNIIDGVIHLHFINVDNDCSVNSIPLERLDMSICPLERVLTSDPFYMENLLPQKYMKYLTEYCRSIQSNEQQLVHDDNIDIEDENDVVGKLIASSKKPRKNSRHFVPDPNNILLTNRSTRSRNKPTEDRSILPATGLEAESAKKKKNSGNNVKRTPKKDVPLTNSNVKKVPQVQLINEKEEIMKYLNDMKNSSETLVKRKMEEISAQLNEFKATNHSQQTQALFGHENHQQMQNSKSSDDISRASILQRNLSNQPNHQRQKQKQQQQHPHSNYSREHIQNPSCFNEVSDNPQQQQQQQHHQQQQKQQKQYPLIDLSRGQQQMHTPNSFNETPRGDSMQRQNQFYNSNYYQQQKQQYQYSSNDSSGGQQQMQNFDEMTRGIIQQQSNFNNYPHNQQQQQYQQYSSNDHSCEQQQKQKSSSFYNRPRDFMQHQNQFDQHHHPQQQQQKQYQQYSSNDYSHYGRQQMQNSSCFHEMPHQSGSMQHQNQFDHRNLYHQPQQQLQLQYQSGASHYNAGQQNVQIFQHPQSYGSISREEVSTFKKVMICDMMDMIKKIN
jgi:hypothetical protein